MTVSVLSRQRARLLNVADISFLLFWLKFLPTVYHVVSYLNADNRYRSRAEMRIAVTSSIEEAHSVRLPFGELISQDMAGRCQRTTANVDAKERKKQSNDERLASNNWKA